MLDFKSFIIVRACKILFKNEQVVVDSIAALARRESLPESDKEVLLTRQVTSFVTVRMH